MRVPLRPADMRALNVTLHVAKIKGCHAVGIVGGTEKCRFVTGELGFDACVDHRARDFADQLQAIAAEQLALPWCNAPFKLQDGPIRRERQGLQRRLLLGKGFVDDALRGRMNTWVGDVVEPLAELRVEIVEVRNEPPRKKSSRMYRNGRSTLPLVLGR